MDSEIAKEACPYYYGKAPDGRWLVPRDPVENLKWRIRCRERALVDKQFQDAFWQACMDDVLFFCAAVLWVHEPRAKVKRRPMIPWPHQEPVILAMDATIDEALQTEHPVSLTLKKSRAQGGTYVYLAVTMRRVLKEPGFTVGLVTRNESLVDSRVDDSAVMFKVAWMLDHLPVWFIPDGYERSMTEHVIKLPNGSGWSGYAATGDVARGGRTTVFCFDEPGSEEFIAGNKDYKVLSSVSHVSNCLAAGTLVVTDRGPVPIEQVHLSDRVWDGSMWASHDGSVCKGEKETISAYGIRLTPDHRVLTKYGWKHAIEGLDRQEIRLPEGYSEEWKLHSTKWKKGQCDVAMPLRLRAGANSDGKRPYRWKTEKLRMREKDAWIQASWDRDIDIQVLVTNDSEMYEPTASTLQGLWRAWYYCLPKMAEVRQLSGRYGMETGRIDAGQDEQRKRVLQAKLLVGDIAAELQQSAYEQSGPYVERRLQGSGTGGHAWRDEISDPPADQKRVDGGRSIASTQNHRPVYDILNCGPRRAFTVIDDDGRPLLCHNCIFLVSTFGVDSGVFYESATDPDNQRVYDLSWQDNPEHAKNMYIVENGVAKAFKPEEQAAVDEYIATHQRELKSIERRGHKIEGKVQSPWYNAHRLQPGATPRFIARELDQDPRGAVGKCFPTDLLDQMKRDHCKPPVWQGDPVFDSETLELKGLLTRPDGKLKLWFKPSIDNMPPLGPFTVACDIALGGDGAYASNSVASGLDDRTGEQVMEYAVKGMDPIQFARMTVGLCKWLRNALLGWEDSGMSGGFAKEVMERLYYGNVFFRDVTQLGSQKKSRKPGFPCRDADKAEMFEMFALAMETGRYKPRSESMIMECGEYEWDGSKIVHAPTKNHGAANMNHGDRCIAASGCWRVFSNDNATGLLDSHSKNVDTIPEYGSFLWREQQEIRKLSSGSPSFGIRDILTEIR